MAQGQFTAADLDPSQTSSATKGQFTAADIDQGAPIAKITNATNPKLNIAASGENMPEYVGATGALGAGLMAGEMAAPAIAPVRGMIAKQMGAHPILGPTVASYLISKAREIPGIGNMIPSGAELMPFLAGHSKNEAPAEEPGAPFPEKPAPEILQGQALQTGSRPAPPNPADALGNIPVARGSIAKSMEPQTSAPSPKPITRGSLSQMMGDQLEKGLGASPPLKPNVPLRGQLSESMKPGPELPEGHTVVDSSALRSYKYDPQTQEFEAWPTSGDTAYRFGEVSPEAAKAFQDAPSKGKAFQQIKNSSTLVAKRVNGKWVSVKPARGSISEQMSK